MTREQLEGEFFIFVPFFLVDVFEAFQFHESFAALVEALVEEASDGEDAIDFFGGELLLILNQTEGGLHSFVVLLLVELTLAQKEEVNCFGTLPGVGKLLVCRLTNVTRN